MFFAVKNGNKKGIFTSKLAFEKSIKDYKDAEYKEFSNMNDAMIYMSGKKVKEIPLFEGVKSKIENEIGSISIKTDFNLKGKFYAVRVGRKVGVYLNWNDCLEQIKHYPNQQFKKFETLKEAENYIQNDIICTDYENNYNDSILNVYTDGSSYHNGKPDALASYGVYFGENDNRNESGLITEKASNNRGELMGILRAIELLKEDEDSIVHTDSMYGLKCVYEYGIKMKNMGYPKEIPNIDIIQKIREVLEVKTKIKFHHLNSHTNKEDKHSLNNAIVDKMAGEVLEGYRKK